MDAKNKLSEVNRIIGETGKDSPEFQKAFMNLMGSTMKGGALDAKTKSFIALALGIAARCPWCISYHVAEAKKAGATRKELMEVGYIAVLMYGSPALMEMNELVDAIDSFEVE
ncbi:MAG: carboxymuconolactone decarboxylase family protein [Ferroplasma sp.]